MTGKVKDAAAEVENVIEEGLTLRRKLLEQ